MSILDTKIEFLKGVGPKRGSLLNQELSIYSFLDLLTFFPYRYVDRSQIYTINQINNFDVDIQIIGYVKNKKEVGVGRKKRLFIDFVDGTGNISILFFKGLNWLNRSIQIGKRYLIFGKPQKYGNQISFIHPEMELLKDSSKTSLYNLYPIYHSTEKLHSVGLNSKGISKLSAQLLSLLKDDVPESFSLNMIREYNFLKRSKAFHEIHFPTDTEKLNQAIYRFKFEELFFLQLSLLKQKFLRRKKFKSFVFEIVGDKFNNFYHNHLGFSLTNAQKKVMKEIRQDVLSGFQMNRLLQGDVGSGKTIVAIMSMILAHDNGFQSCLMAPTEILANQHFNNIEKIANNIGLKAVLLTGKTTSSVKKQIISELSNNLIDIVVGTHALIQENVRFQKLGLVIIDEQHKFGVSQRAKLWKHEKIMPHVLVMTATPIPRTLAMTAYGDLDVSVIDELPPGRKPVLTSHKYDKEIKGVFAFVYHELKKHKQVYIVYPLIEESKVLDYKNLQDGYENIKSIFETKGFKISILHGRLKKEEKQLEMKKFLDKETQIMVATTVIEVGVDVPNATIMIIQNAEKFGLSQLHQLRGRVGRGSEKSYCFLVSSNKLTNDAKTRLKTMVNSHDGFEIAEVDLKLRGPGDILGTRQSGLLNLKLSSLVKDYAILNLARKAAQNLLEKDFDLSQVSNRNIRHFFLKHLANKLKWGSVA